MTAITTREISIDHLSLSKADAQLSRRKSYDNNAIHELAADIKEQGILQPIVARHLPNKPGHYEIVAGERRFRAAQLAGLQQVPVTLREMDDAAAARAQLAENLQRADLSPLHEAEAYAALITEHKVTRDALPALVCKEPSYVARRLKLLELQPAALKALAAGEISVGVAETIARIPVPALQNDALRETSRMTVKQAAKHVGERYMMGLSRAPFDITDVTLPGGACGVCPKRTGNQAALFADVADDQRCTDLKCHGTKVREAGTRAIAAAKASGQKVIAAAEAKKHSDRAAFLYSDSFADYYRVTGEAWIGHRQVKIKSVLKESSEIVKLQCPETGRVYDVVHKSQLAPPKRERGTPNPHNETRRDEQARARQETKVRRAVFAALVAKGKWKPPALRTLAELAIGAMDYHGADALSKALAPPNAERLKNGNLVQGGFDPIRKLLKACKTDADIHTLLCQVWLARDLHVNSYDRSPKMDRLEEAAKFARVDVAAIRTELKPKPKPKKKPKAKPKKKARAAKGKS